MKIRRGTSLFQDILRAGMMTAIAVGLVSITRIAFAHAVLVLSSPAANAIVQGPDVPISIKFNSRVDGTRSTLMLSAASGQPTPLALEKQNEADMLSTHAMQLAPGKYAIRWQVLAVDGHITRGQIPFQVK